MSNKKELKPGSENSYAWEPPEGELLKGLPSIEIGKSEEPIPTRLPEQIESSLVKSDKDHPGERIETGPWEPQENDNREIRELFKKK